MHGLLERLAQQAPHAGHGARGETGRQLGPEQRAHVLRPEPVERARAEGREQVQPQQLLVPAPAPRGHGAPLPRQPAGDVSRPRSRARPGARQGAPVPQRREAGELPPGLPLGLRRAPADVLGPVRPVPDHELPTVANHRPPVCRVHLVHGSLPVGALAAPGSGRGRSPWVHVLHSFCLPLAWDGRRTGDDCLASPEGVWVAVPATPPSRRDCAEIPRRVALGVRTRLAACRSHLPSCPSCRRPAPCAEAGHGRPTVYGPASAWAACDRPPPHHSRSGQPPGPGPCRCAEKPRAPGVAGWTAEAGHGHPVERRGRRRRLAATVQVRRPP